METDYIFRILDSYTVQTGLGAPDMPMHKTPQQAMAESVKLSNWSIADAQTMKAPMENDMRWLHMDDNVSALGSYNDEKTILNYWRTRIIPAARRLETAFVNALLVKVHSDAFYSQFESLCDGIFDFRSREDGTRLLQEARVRVIRGKPCDTRWRQLELKDNGEVKIIG